MRIGHATIVALLGLCLGAPQAVAQSLTASPAALRFSSVGTETAGTEKLLRITNKGSADLSVTLIRREGGDRDDFSQTNTCGVVLPPRGSCNVSVRFASETPGIKSAFLILESSAGLLSVPLAGVAVGPIVTWSPRALSFSKINVGAESPAKFFSIRNAGKGVLRLGNFQLAGPQANDFVYSHDCPDALLPRASCRGAVNFQPTDGGARVAAIRVSTNDGDHELVLGGVGYQDVPRLSISPSERVSFSSQGTEVESAVKRIKVVNRGGAPLQVTRLVRSGEDRDAFAQTNTCGAPLLPRGECEIAVTFTPKQVRAYNAALSVQSNSGEVSLALLGVGVGPRMRLSTAKVDFQTQPLGLESEVRRVAVRNSGKGLLRVESISLSGPDATDFTYRPDCDSPVAPGGECAVSLSFRPTAMGSRQALLTVTGNAIPQVLRISGKAGASPPVARLSIDVDSIEVRAGQSITVPFSALSSDGRVISLPRVSWSISDAAVAVVSDSGVVSAARYDGFDVKSARITVTAGSVTASAMLRVTPDSAFRGYRVSDQARALGSAYWENTPAPLDLILRVFLTRHKNHPQQYSGWSGALTAGDFNKDGFIDVFTAGSACAGMQSRPTFLIWNPATWRFDEKNLFNDRTDYLGGPMGVAPVYLNEDDYVDLVIIGHSDECARPELPNEPVRIALSDGKGGYDLHVLALQSEEMLRRFGQEYGDVGDVTGDGLPDLLISANSHAYIFRGLAQFPYFSGDNFSHFASDIKNFPDAQNGFGERVPNAAEFAFGGKLIDVDDDGRNDYVMLTTEDAATPRQPRIFLNQGAGRFTANQFRTLPFFYDERFPAPSGRIAHLMDLHTDDVNGDGFRDVIGVNQESYQQWNLIVYRANGRGDYAIDRDAVVYLDAAAARPKYKTILVKTDFDGDGRVDFGYHSFGSAYENLANKSVFLSRDRALREYHIKDVDPYAKWLFSKIIPYGCPYECVE